MTLLYEFSRGELRAVQRAPQSAMAKVFAGTYCNVVPMGTRPRALYAGRCAKPAQVIDSTPPLTRNVTLGGWNSRIRVTQPQAVVTWLVVNLLSERTTYYGEHST